jgi:hypothetical protein
MGEKVLTPKNDKKSKDFKMTFLKFTFYCFLTLLLVEEEYIKVAIRINAF